MARLERDDAMKASRWLLLILCAFSFIASAQQRRVAITIDDLPYVSHTGTALTPADLQGAREVNHQLLRALKEHRVPVTGFVNEGRVQGLGANSGVQILRQWIAEDLDLGNHTYSHPDINRLSVAQIEDEILRGEATIAPLMKETGKRVEFFRFPMNHTGDNKAKHDAIAAFLADHGYKLATCTIENSDYLFNDAYVRFLAQKDQKAAKKLRLEYLAYTSSEIDYFGSLNKRVLGYEPPQVMLLHDNRLNADVMTSVLELFEKKGYKFVSLSAAESDAAYSIPDTYLTQYGPMWGYRWAKERNLQLDGRLEPEPPQWIVNSGPNPATYNASRRRRGE